MFRGRPKLNLATSAGEESKTALARRVRRAVAARSLAGYPVTKSPPTRIFGRGSIRYHNLLCLPGSPGIGTSFAPLVPTMNRLVRPHTNTEDPALQEGEGGEGVFGFRHPIIQKNKKRKCATSIVERVRRKFFRELFTLKKVTVDLIRLRSGRLSHCHPPCRRFCAGVRLSVGDIVTQHRPFPCVLFRR